LVLALIIGFGLVYGYIAAKNKSLSVSSDPPIIAVTPSEELYKMALESAREEKTDAQLCSMDFFRTSNDERVEYRTDFGFRSPSNPDWYYSLSIVPDETIFGPRLRIRGHEYTEDFWRWTGCLDDLVYPELNNLEAIEAMRKAGGSLLFEYLEEWPGVLWLRQSPDGKSIWEAEFSYREDGGLNTAQVVIKVDAQTGDKIEVSTYDLRELFGE
jgi:hypothetical protein